MAAASAESAIFTVKTDTTPPAFSDSTFASQRTAGGWWGTAVTIDTVTPSCRVQVADEAGYSGLDVNKSSITYSTNVGEVGVPGPQLLVTGLISSITMFLLIRKVQIK
jgi:hypothetical protein